jgi:hypothetical protein
MIPVKKTGQRHLQSAVTKATAEQFICLDFGTLVKEKTRRLSIERLETIRQWSSLDHATWQRYCK